MSSAAAVSQSVSDSALRALVVCPSLAKVEQITSVLSELEVSSDVLDYSDARLAIKQSRYECVFVDLHSLPHAQSFVSQYFASSSRAAVLVGIVSERNELNLSFSLGALFVLDISGPTSLIRRTLKVAYPLVLRAKRSTFRYPVRVAVRITPHGKAPVELPSVNLSQTGIAVELADALVLNEKVAFDFVLPGCDTRFSGKAEVRWCSSKLGRAGLRFDPLPREMARDLECWLGQELEKGLPRSLQAVFMA